MQYILGNCVRVDTRQGNASIYHDNVLCITGQSRPPRQANVVAWRRCGEGEVAGHHHGIMQVKRDKKGRGSVDEGSKDMWR